MYILLSPAKSLDFSREFRRLPSKRHIPIFELQTETLHRALKKMSVDEIARLMRISPKLAQLNYERFQSWIPDYSKQEVDDQGNKEFDVALSVFAGDVYQQFDLNHYTEEDWEYADEHIGILSGFYGILSPLTVMKPYRLEMGTKLFVQLSKKGNESRNLYEFWDTMITDHINSIMLQQSEDDRIVVNLASVEYAKVVDFSALKAKVIDVVFQVYSKGVYKVVGIRAKKARGAMANAIVKERIKSPSDLREIVVEGFSYDANRSDDSRYVYTITLS